MNQAPLSPLSALLAHVEPYVAGRRILVIGNAGHSAAGHLLERGARLVQVFDPDARRVAVAAAQNTERKVTFAQLTPHALRDGSFEMALIEDIELAESFDGLIAGVKRALGASGVAIFCARNSETSSGLLGAARGGVTYDDFSEALWDQFENVSVWGQSPFLGYSIVQFGLERPPEPVLDNGYIGDEGEPPDFYIAICESAGDFQPLSEMSIVQLPTTRLLLDSETGHREKERRAARRVETLEQEVAQLRRQVASSEVERLVTLLEERDHWIKQLESRAAQADARADDAEAEVDELEQELEQTHKTLLTQAKDLKQAVSERDSARQQGPNLQTELKNLQQQLLAAREHESEVTHLSAGRKALEEEINTLAQENGDLKKTVSHQSSSVDKLQKRIEILDAEVDDLHKQLDETEEYLRDAEDELHGVRVQLETAEQTLVASVQSADQEKEVSNLEEQLTERGRRVLELENQMRKLENYSRSLKAELSAPNWVKEDGMQTEFEQLARTLAEREADLVEAEWTIGQLRRANKN